MAIEVKKVGVEALRRWAEVPISFLVESILGVCAIEGGLGGLSLTELKLDRPYIRDYDLHEHELPTRWLRFDVSNWGFFHAVDGNQVVGCVAVAGRTSEIRLLEDRHDIALLWDIRVTPERRRSGIGAELFRAAVDFARSQGYRQLRVETQNVNVPACKFYARQGCILGQIRRQGYPNPEIAHETMLLWYLEL